MNSVFVCFPLRVECYVCCIGKQCIAGQIFLAGSFFHLVPAKKSMPCFEQVPGIAYYNNLVTYFVIISVNRHIATIRGISIINYENGTGDYFYTRSIETIIIL